MSPIPLRRIGSLAILAALLSALTPPGSAAPSAGAVCLPVHQVSLLTAEFHGGCSYVTLKDQMECATTTSCTYTLTATATVAPGTCASLYLSGTWYNLEPIFNDNDACKLPYNIAWSDADEPVRSVTFTRDFSNVVPNEMLSIHFHMKNPYANEDDSATWTHLVAAPPL